MSLYCWRNVSKGVFFWVIAMWFHLVWAEWTLCWMLCRDLFFVRENSKTILIRKDGSAGCLCQHVKWVLTSEYLQNQLQSSLTSSSISSCFLLLLHGSKVPFRNASRPEVFWQTFSVRNTLEDFNFLIFRLETQHESFFAVNGCRVISRHQEVCENVWIWRSAWTSSWTMVEPDLTQWNQLYIMWRRLHSGLF